jgi:predicted phosphohydrolase
MRLLATADLHFNHAKSRELARQCISDMNAAGGDVLLLVGDTASGDAGQLEEALSLFTFDGPKLFVAGNHELWTRTGDTRTHFEADLPARVRAMGWHWLEGAPFVAGDVAIVGSVGWYDYSFAPPSLNIPRRFYEAKVSPGAAERLSEFAHLLGPDVPPEAGEILARWNDGKFIRLGESDESFLKRLLEGLKAQLDALVSQRTILAAVHHLPFASLVPPRHSASLDFAWAYLGSGRIGELLLRYPNVQRVLCGHSHFAAAAQEGHIAVTNIGSGYRQKRFLSEEI